MGRPLKDSILFFSHDVNAPRNWKFSALHAHYGGEKGWAMEAKFWALNCMIGEAAACRLDLTKAGIEADVAKKLDLSIQDLREFVAFLSNREICDLLNNDNGIIWTDRCQEELDSVRKAREHDRSRKSSGGPIPDGIQPDKQPGTEFSGGDSTDADRKTPFSGGNPSGKGSIPAGIQLENHIIQPDSGRKKGFSGQLGRGGREGRGGGPEPENSGAQKSQPIPVPAGEPPAAAPFSDRLKTELAAAGLHLTLTDFEACASKMIASSADEAFVAYAIGKARKGKQPSTWFVKGILEWNWIAKWRENGAPSKPATDNGYHTPTTEEMRAERDAATPEEVAAAALKAAKFKHEHGMKLDDDERKLLGLPAPAESPAAAAEEFVDDFPEVPS